MLTEVLPSVGSIIYVIIMMVLVVVVLGWVARVEGRGYVWHGEVRYRAVVILPGNS